MTENFKELMEKSLGETSALSIGNLVKTSILKVFQDEVLLDIGTKSETRLDINEFDFIPKEGDTIEVYVEKVGPSYVKVSYKKANEIKTLEEIKNAYKNNGEVEGKVVDLVKGGYKVLINGVVEAFLPLSQVSLDKVENPEKYKGRLFRLKVADLKEGKNGKINVVVSRKPILEDVKQKKVEKLYSELKVGDEVGAKILKINPKSIIVSIDDIETALIRGSDISWDRVEPEKIFKVGQNIKAKVIEIDKNKRKILLSIKDLKQDPWISFTETHKEGDVIEGRIVEVGDRFVIVKIKDGVTGIIRADDFSWSTRIKKPSDIVKINDIVSAKILKIDSNKRSIVLGLKQLKQDPWENVEEKYPIGKKVKGKIINKQDFGIFLELEEGIDALLHKNDIDWTISNIDLSKYKEGDTIEVVVIKVEPSKKKIKVGLKQLFDNPWLEFANSYPKGSVVKGKIDKIEDNGIILRFNDTVTGFLPKKHLDKRYDNLNEFYKIGDEIDAMVIELDPYDNKLVLSVRLMIDAERKKELEKYIASSETKNVTLGDILGNKIENITKNKVKKETHKSKEKIDNKIKNDSSNLSIVNDEGQEKENGKS
ncbi:MAG TPA: S1 RNA-binding domain-containing protein [Spirochaetota bacterium]|nr:S1 RNA-binding domain-containing protein [Spirochaetota bacterium]HOM38012.1 S1 RNA-binding domain-containing protein [Spirochaetota bacterium]HPQ48816.1 S1 RNA-binding domain-containing protein [Spirochaetota bacterium]